MKVSSWALGIEEYVFARLAREADAVEKRSGRKVLNLGAGNPDIPPSRRYIAALQRFVEEKEAHWYPGYVALAEFAETVGDWYRKRFSMKGVGDLGALPLLGAKDGIMQVSRAVLDAGDEVLIPDPGYPVYRSAAEGIGAAVIPYSTGEDIQAVVDLPELERLVSKKTKLLWANFPNNPTGQVIERQELAKLVDFCRERQIWLAYDNAYSEITFGEYRAPSVLEIIGAIEIAVELGSFSKMCSFAGFRMGWLIGNADLVQVVTALKSQADSGMMRGLQQLGAYALKKPDNEWHTNLIREYEQRQKNVLAALQRLGLECARPLGGLYIWVRVPGGDGEVFSQQLLNEKQILVTPGLAYGKAGKAFVRASICGDVSRLEEYL